MAINSTATDNKPADSGFTRRYYSSWKAFWSDISFMFSHRDQIRSAMRSPSVDEVFRERLMLAVTEINQCRYCRTFHVGQARQAGISQEEINIYLCGTIPDDIPENQKLAVCYAQHWAETDANPDQDYLNQVREVYSEEGFETISMALRMIRMGNLLGNTVDYFLFKISFGKLGG